MAGMRAASRNRTIIRHDLADMLIRMESLSSPTDDQYPSLQMTRTSSIARCLPLPYRESYPDSDALLYRVRHRS
jgi:hypothetical protein